MITIYIKCRKFLINGIWQGCEERKMSKVKLKFWLLSPLALGTILWVGDAARGTEATQYQLTTPVSDNAAPVIATKETAQFPEPTVTQVKTSIPIAESQDKPVPITVAQISEDTSNAAVLEQINRYTNQSGTDSLDQVTNVSQLRDVSPGDWAYEALRSLVERYGCIAGYPDGTYRGNRAMTRYEFAAGLNACLNQIERLIGTNSNGVDSSDLETLQRLVQEFQAELTTLGARVDNLEGRVAFLEDHQFSTTTKLNGAVIFALAGIAAGENAGGGDIDEVTAFGDRVRLNFDTSFTGKDLLRTRLQALNLDAFSGSSTFTPEGDLRFADGTFGTDSGNDVEIDALLYQFSMGEKTTVVIEANAGAPDDFANTVNPYIDGDGDSGAISNFGTRNPIYGLVGGAGIGIRHQFSDALELSLGYLASDAANPGDDGGLFNGPYGALAQLTVKPFDQLTLGLLYVHSYNSDLTAGSNRANLRSALADNPNLPEALQPFSGLSLPTSSNSYGLQASWQFSPKIVLGGWAGYTATRTLSTLDGTIDRGDLSIWNWAVTLAFPDLGKEGSIAGIIVGMEPKVTDVSRALRNAIGKDPDTSLHIEAFYQYQLTDNIAITPGIIWLTAPDHNSDNEDVVIGSIRTTFTF
ncbi:MAG TPA: porin [Cyanobacteria bacterium UBA9273]|nr:porin [Cyanobacteria bacterium UBA9273]